MSYRRPNKMGANGMRSVVQQQAPIRLSLAPEACATLERLAECYVDASAMNGRTVTMDEAIITVVSTAIMAYVEAVNEYGHELRQQAMGLEGEED